MTKFVHSIVGALMLVLILAPVASRAQQAEGEGQDDVSKAMDSTATQWSFQFA